MHIFLAQPAREFCNFKFRCHTRPKTKENNINKHWRTFTFHNSDSFSCYGALTRARVCVCMCVCVCVCVCARARIIASAHVCYRCRVFYSPSFNHIQ